MAKYNWGELRDLKIKIEASFKGFFMTASTNDNGVMTCRHLRYRGKQQYIKDTRELRKALLVEIHKRILEQICESMPESERKELIKDSETMVSDFLLLKEL